MRHTLKEMLNLQSESDKLRYTSENTHTISRVQLHPARDLLVNKNDFPFLRFRLRGNQTTIQTINVDRFTTFTRLNLKARNIISHTF